MSRSAVSHPVSWLETTGAFGAYALQGVREPHIWVTPRAIIADRALAAERSAAEAVLGIANHVDAPSRRGFYEDAASIVAVAGTGCAYHAVDHHRIPL